VGTSGPQVGDPVGQDDDRTDDDMLREDEPLAIEVASAIRSGDVGAVRQLIEANPGLAAERLGNAEGSARTPLHVVTDWPGFFPNGPQMTRLLLDAGADPDARTEAGGGGETPLHWAASSDDADVAGVLIDGGADVEIPDGSIGTPLDNAVGYACWNVARLLVGGGARVDKLWHAAALGLTGRLAELLSGPAPAADEINQAFFHACDGGQRRAAELLLAHGADINASPDYGNSPLEAAANVGTQRNLLIEWLLAHGAQTSSSS
jgi:ankyrin repeat protein